MALTPGGEVVIARADEHAKELVVLERTTDGFKTRGRLAGGPTKCHAISPDGRSLAVVTAFFSEREGDVVLYDLTTLERVQRFGEGHRIGGGHAVVAFQADGGGLVCLKEGEVLWLLGQDGTECRIADVDAIAFSPDGHTVAVFVDDVVRVEGLAFSPDGARLLVACDTHFNRFWDEDDDCVAIWSLPHRRYLGALAAGPQGVHAVAAEEFFGTLQAPKKRKHLESLWNRPDVARATLLDQPVDALLDERMRALLADLEARWAFFSDLRTARDAQADKPTFGGGATKKPPLTADLVVAAARTLAARPEAERQQVHEELLAQAIAAEEARARMQTPLEGKRSAGRSKATHPPPGDAASWPAEPAPAAQAASRLPLIAILLGLVAAAAAVWVLLH